MALIGEKRRERRVVQVMSSDLKLCSSKRLRESRLVQVMSSDLKLCSSKRLRQRRLVQVMSSDLKFRLELQASNLKTLPEQVAVDEALT